MCSTAFVKLWRSPHNKFIDFTFSTVVPQDDQLLEDSKTLGDCGFTNQTARPQAPATVGLAFRINGTFSFLCSSNNGLCFYCCKVYVYIFGLNNNFPFVFAVVQMRCLSSCTSRPFQAPQNYLMWWSPRIPVVLPTSKRCSDIGERKWAKERRMEVCARVVCVD